MKRIIALFSSMLLVTAALAGPPVIWSGSSAEVLPSSVTVGSGSVSAPSYSFVGDTNTGLYRTGADALALTAAGANVWAYGSSTHTFTGKGVFADAPSGAPTLRIGAAQTASGSSTQSLTVTRNGSDYATVIQNLSTTASNSFGLLVQGGTNSSDRVQSWATAGGTTIGLADGSGAWKFGPTDSTTTTHTLYGFTVLKQGAATGGSAPQNTVYIVKNTAAGNNAGDVYVTFHSNGNTGATNFDIRSDGTGGAFSPVSDLRLKKNVRDSEPILSKLLRLRPVNFSWKTNNAVQTGFIAQEVQTVFPEDVEENKEGWLQVTGWGRREAMFVKAFQEQQKMIEGLQKRVSVLEAQLPQTVPRP